MLHDQLESRGFSSVHELVVGWIQANQIDELEVFR